MARVKKTYVPGKNRNHKHHNWWKYLLCILLGQILIIPELVIGIGTAASSITNEQLFNMLGLKPEDYLSDDIKQDTLLSLTAKLIGGNYKFESLQDVSQLTPALENLYNQYGEFAANYGVTIDKDEFFTTKFSDFGAYALNLLMDIKPGITLETTQVPLNQVPVLSQLGPSILYKIPLARIELVTGGDSPTPIPENFVISLTDDTKSHDLSENIKYYPAETTEKEIAWTSSDESIAKIDGNTVEAVSIGEAVLTAKPCDGAPEQTIKVEVSNFTPVPEPDPQPEPEPQPETKSRPIYRDEKTDEGGEGGKTDDGSNTDDGGEGGNTQENEKKHEGDHHYTDGHCDVILSDGSVCDEVWKEARTLGEIINMFKEKQFAKMFGDTSFGDLVSIPGFAALDTIKVAELFENPMGALGSLSIGSFLGGASGNPVIDTLGSFTINELMDQETFNSLTIGKLLNINEEATGIEGLLRDCSLSMDSIMGAINDAKVGDLITIDPNDSLMVSLSDCYIMKTDDHGGIESAISTLKLGDVMKDMKDTDMLYAFKDYTIDELSSKFSTMYLYELLKTRTYVAEEDVGSIVDNKITVGTTTYDVLYDSKKENKPYYITATGVTKLLCETIVTTGSGDDETTDYLNLGNMQEGMGTIMETATIRDILGESEDQYVKLFLDCSLSDIGDRITTLKIGEIMPDASTGILGALSDCYLSARPEGVAPDFINGTNLTCQEKIESLKLSNILSGLDSNPNPVIQLIKDAYLYEQELKCDTCGQKPLNPDSASAGDACENTECTGHLFINDGDSVLSIIDHLTIGEAMNIDPKTEQNGMLKALANVSVSKPDEITSAIKNCVLSDLIDIDDDSPAMLQELKNTKLNELDSAFNNIHVTSLIGEDQMFETVNDTKQLKGIWMLMFNDVASAESATVQQFPTYMSNLTENITTANLDKLASVGIVKLSEQQLNKKLGGVRVGTLTLEAIINIAMAGAQD